MGTGGSTGHGYCAWRIRRDGPCETCKPNASDEVLAAGPSSHIGTGSIDILERTAEKLGINAEELKSAYSEALAELRREAADERLDGHLDSLVENGTITQGEADEYRLWYETRPNFVRGSGFGFGGGDVFFRSFGHDTVIEEFVGLLHGPRFRQLEGGGGFRFFYGLHGDEDVTDEVPAEGTSA